MSTKILATLYKYDELKRPRIWRMYLDESDASYWTSTGLVEGTLIDHERRYGIPMNVGRSNETTPLQQAYFEANALIKRQQEINGYASDIAESGKSHFQPMLAKSYSDLKPLDKDGIFPVISQPKLDGIRCIMTIDGCFSRNGKPITAVDFIHDEAMKWIFKTNPNLILDGELYNHDLHDNFEEIVSIVRKAKPSPKDIEKAKESIQYHIYDMIDPDHSESNSIRWTQRLFLTKYRSEEEGWSNYIRFVDTEFCKNQKELDDLYGRYLSDGYEGQMIRLPHGKYENKRSKNLLKRKEFLDGEFTIISLEEGVGNWAGYVKALTYQLPDGRTFNSGLRGSQEFCKVLLNEKDQYVGGTATIRYQNLSSDGVLRFPVAIALFKKGEIRP